MRSLRSRLHPVLQRQGLAAALAVAFGLTAPISTLAQTPPPGVGVYVSAAVAGTNNYVGNGSVQYATGPGITIYSGGGLAIDGQPLFAVTSPLDMPLGLTTATVSAIGSSGAGSALGEAVATADLAGGVLRASASGVSTTGYVPIGPASARVLTTSFMRDYLTFAVAGGGSADITVTAHLDGSYALHDPVYGQGSQAMGLSIGGAAFSELGFVNATASGYGHNGASGYVPPYGWESYSFSNQSAAGFDFTGVLRVSDLERTAVGLGLDLDCWGATCGFEHTGSIGIVLPDNVSYSSDSGVFLTAGVVTAPVPEPETWALMAAGLAIVGKLTRRRLRA